MFYEINCSAKSWNYFQLAAEKLLLKMSSFSHFYESSSNPYLTELSTYSIRSPSLYLFIVSGLSSTIVSSALRLSPVLSLWPGAANPLLCLCSSSSHSLILYCVCVSSSYHPPRLSLSTVTPFPSYQSYQLLPHTSSPL